MQLLQVAEQHVPWCVPSVLVEVERGLASGAIAREVVALLTPDFAGTSETDEALVALLPWLRPAAERYYRDKGAALRALLTKRECGVLDRWAAAELEALTEVWRALDAASERHLSRLRRIPEQLRSHLRSRPLPARVGKVLLGLERCAVPAPH